MVSHEKYCNQFVVSFTFNSKKDETNLLETKEIIKQYLFEFEWFILLHNIFESFESLMDFSKMLDTHTKELIRFFNTKNNKNLHLIEQNVGPIFLSYK